MPAGKLFLQQEDEGRTLVDGIYRHDRHFEMTSLSIVRNYFGARSVVVGGSQHLASDLLILGLPEFLP